MKILYFILFASWTLCKSSYSQIPNNDFETWNDIGGWYEDPDSWQTNNTQLTIAEVVKDTDAYSGTYAARLTNYTLLVPFLYAAFSIAAHPAHLNFYAKVSLNENDSVWARVMLFHSGNAVDSGRWSVVENISNYTLISLPLSNSFPNSDSVIIEVHGGTQYGTDVKIDQLEFDYDFNSIINTSSELYVAAIQNPFQELLQLTILTSASGFYDVQLFDATGKLQMSKTGIESNKTSVEIYASALSTGIYFCVIRKENSFNTLKLVKL